MSAAETLLEGLASGGVDGALDRTPEALSAALDRGQALVDATEDPALKAGLQGALDELAKPENEETLVAAARHEIVAVTAFVGLKLGASARLAFLSDERTSFEQRHALLASDDAAVRQAALDHTTFVGGLEAIAGRLLLAAGGAAVPFLLAIF